MLPDYVYVASSWRNPMQVAVVHALRLSGIDCYDFRNDEGGFRWSDVKGSPHIRDGESIDDYLRMIAHPLAINGFNRDFAAMDKADVFVLVLPCGRSAHLELGWAIGMKKRTAILLEDPIEPELMYRMVDYLAPSLFNLLGWLGVKD